jgi:hypothetical protein
MGFELETQATEGKGYRCTDGYEFDEWCQEKAEDIVNNDYSTWEMANVIEDGSGPLTCLTTRQIERVLEALEIESLSEYDSTFDDCIEDGAVEAERERIYDCPEDYGWEPLPDFDLPGGIECGEDGSVDGFEFRTYGGYSLGRCIEMAADLMGLDHEIDRNCSFHIHIADKLRPHRYTKLRQLRMYKYLLENLDKIPTALLERRARTHWIKFQTGTGKGPAISYRNRTWEFRLWGNIGNAEDAETCLRLTRDIFKARLDTRYDCTEEVCEELGKAMDEMYEQRLQEIAA